jgi:hypothetical protein
MRWFHCSPYDRLLDRSVTINYVRHLLCSRYGEASGSYKPIIVQFSDPYLRN